MFMRKMFPAQNGAAGGRPGQQPLSPEVEQESLLLDESSGEGEELIGNDGTVVEEEENEIRGPMRRREVPTWHVSASDDSPVGAVKPPAPSGTSLASKGSQTVSSVGNAGKDKVQQGQPGGPAAQRGPAAPPRTTVVALSFLAVFLVMFLTILNIPPLSSVDEEGRFVWRPKRVEDFKTDKEVMLAYRDKHAVSLFVGMVFTYVIAQTFCVPGSGTTLNLLSGCVYADYVQHGEYLVALPYCILCATAGALGAYSLSYLTARDFLYRKFPQKVGWLRNRIADLEPSSRLMFFLSLRVSPLCPAWFLNVAAPLTPLPIWMFLVATMLGSAPSSLLLVKTGAAISNMQAGEDVLANNMSSLAGLFVIALVVFSIPFVAKRHIAASDVEMAELREGNMAGKAMLKMEESA